MDVGKPTMPLELHWFFVLLALSCFVTACGGEVDNHSKAPLAEAKKQLSEGELTIDPEKRDRKYENAVQLATRAIESDFESDESYVEALQIRARALHYLGQYESAIEDLDAAIAIDQSNLDLVYQRAMVYQFVGESEEVVNEFTRLIELKDSYPLVYRIRGGTYLKLGRYAEAVDDLTRELMDNPDDLVVIELRGDAFAALNNHTDAISDYSRAITKDRELGVELFGSEGTDRYSFGELELRLKLGKSFEKVGRFDDAAAEYRRILASDPTNPEALDRIADLRQLTDND